MSETKGLYRKFDVRRTDGSSEPGGKHENCRYFVLDLDHDPHALPAIKAYAESCRAGNPALADDLKEMACFHPSKFLQPVTPGAAPAPDVYSRRPVATASLPNKQTISAKDALKRPTKGKPPASVPIKKR